MSIGKKCQQTIPAYGATSAVSHHRDAGRADDDRGGFAAELDVDALFADAGKAPGEVWRLRNQGLSSSEAA